MTISRSQMYRQLRNKGGIMNAIPRQSYFLGGIGDAIKDTVKGVAKGISGLIKSPMGKAALIGGGLFGIPGTQFGGLLGKGSIANIIGQKAMTQAPFAKGTGLKGFFQNILGGEKTLGTTAKVFAGGTALGAVLEAAGLDTENPSEMSAATRDIDALKGYLRKGYKTLNPEADETEVESFVEANTREYAATGGRIGFRVGSGEGKDTSGRDYASNTAASRSVATSPSRDMGGDGNNNKPSNTFVENMVKTIAPDRSAVLENLNMLYSKNLRPNLAFNLGISPLAFMGIDDPRTPMDESKMEPLSGGISYDTGNFNMGIGLDQYGDPTAGIQYRKQFARGTDEIVDQASGIIGLPKRINGAGVKELDLRESGGFIPPVGVKEKADDIPAMLSNNEFVFTADAVRGMGNGNVNKGAQRMYDMMKKLESKVV